MTPTQIRHSDRNKTQENKSNQKHTNRHVNKKQADKKKKKTHIDTYFMSIRQTQIFACAI